MILQKIPVSKYREFSYETNFSLKRNYEKKLKNKNALIVKNHGVFGKGKTLDEALKINEKIEEIAKKHYLNLFL